VLKRVMPVVTLVFVMALGACSSTPTALKTTTTTSPTTTTTSSSTIAPRSPSAPPCDSKPGGGSGIRPKLIFFGCATSANNLSHITWNSWTLTGAAGTAVHNINDCQPNCAEGEFTSFPVKVQLSRPGTVDGLLVFQLITTTPTSAAGKPQSATATHLYGVWGWPSS
jgi:hypothetical protein